MTSRQIGIIGVGMMGHGIARNIRAKGWPLAYLDHPGNQPTADLDAAGAVRIGDAGSLAARCDILIFCVTGSAEIEALLIGPSALTPSLRPGTILIDCSTGIPATTTRVAEIMRQAGCRFIDAAMTRTPREAEEGRLNLLIGGDLETVEEVTPLLEAFSENRFHAGGVGTGQMLKLVHNFVSIGTATLVCEAAACASAGGIDPTVLVDCLRRGGGYGAALDRVAPYLLEGELAQMRFTNANARKDLRYYDELVSSIGTRHDIASGVLSALEWLNDSGHGDEMVPEASAAFRHGANA